MSPIRAGGTRLNLTAANHVIHYDLWWNPAVEDQGTDRTFRIGQVKRENSILSIFQQ
ncbi:MAG: SWF/SNF helicase family protein [Thermotogae bacterium]|nr:SWF/SNF helicase family protein [Thermotogota bacterium]MCL5033390.1 SWF/SNF helicase family protein [Thermotogota bacterium]